MNLKPGQIYEGFRLIEVRKIAEIDSIGRIFIHEKSGARLMQLENADDNNVFSICFRTPPQDDTGLPHIMEHSVLCGSRKYPLKEPFLELLKGSLNTFLNAFTFADKTLYPVASRNEKDFFNLIDVYLDAVFYPSIYKCPEIFWQEGWHHELDDKDREIVYKGVVYNEMRGAFSTPETLLASKIQESLFPDTAYRFEAEGDPDAIPTLTQEKFLDFHRRYYCPQNSYIYLYGDGDILKRLKFLDGYLSKFDKVVSPSTIELQKPIKREITVDYPISPTETEKDKSFLSLNFVMGEFSDYETNLASNILEHMLIETPASPLRKALLDSGIGKDILGNFDNDIRQPVLSIIAKNSNPKDLEKFKEIVFETLETLVKNGIDGKLIEASINAMEFELREAYSEWMPKGLIYNIWALSTWLYGGDPFITLEYQKTFERISSLPNYFEGLIEKKLIENGHSSLVMLRPDPGLGERKSREIAQKLAEYGKNLSEREVNELINQTGKLKMRQSTPDPPDDLAKLPLLTLGDINPTVDKDELPTVERDEGGTKVLFHPIFTNGIAYVNFLFDTTAVEQHLLPYIGLLADVLTKMKTPNHGYEDLANEININTGGIEVTAEAYAENGSDSIYYPKLIVRSKALIDKIPDTFHLILEVANTRFDDKKRLKEIIQETRSALEKKILEEGHYTASDRLASYFSEYGAYGEVLDGFSYFKFISEIEKKFDEEADKIIADLYRVANAILTKSMLISATLAESDWEIIQKNLPALLNGFRGDGKLTPLRYKFDLKRNNEGFLTRSDVQYVAKGYNINVSRRYGGDLLVLKTALQWDYLWNRLRVMGGAYGGRITLERDGNMIFSSYRDPNLVETLEIYDEAADYLKDFRPDEREMTKYIIGTVGELDRPLTPAVRGERATKYWISKVNRDDLQRERDEVLGTKPEDIRRCADLIAEMMGKNYFCALGNGAKIRENREIFGQLVEVFE